MNLDQRISNLERNSSKSTTRRIELVNTGSLQSIANATTTTVGNGTGTTAWTVAENLGGIFTHSSGRITCTIAGRYSVWAAIRWSENSTVNLRQLIIQKNSGGTAVDLTSVVNPSVNVLRQALAITSVRLAANDTLDLRVLQDSGAARTLGAQTSIPFYFIVEYLGA